MMVKLFDKDMTLLKVFDNYMELIVTQELDLGYKTLQMQLPYSITGLQEEQKVEVDGYVYVIKEINMGQQLYYQVYCKPYFSDLLSKRIDSLTGYNRLLEDCLREVISDTTWSYVIESPVVGSFTINLHQKTAIEALDALKKLYQFDYFFDTKNKIIHIWKQRIGKDILYVLDSDNLRYCKSQSNTYNLITRLIPVGKDGVLINQVNGNCAWVEDFGYTDEVIIGYWFQSSIQNADDLLSLAKDRIKDISRPKTSYRIQLIEVPPDARVGDIILIIDKIKNIQTQQQIKKIVIYYNEFQNSYIEAGSILTSFDDIYKDFKDAQDIVNEDTLRNLRELNIL